MAAADGMAVGGHHSPAQEERSRAGSRRNRHGDRRSLGPRLGVDGGAVRKEPPGGERAHRLAEPEGYRPRRFGDDSAGGRVGGHELGMRGGAARGEEDREQAEEGERRSHGARRSGSADGG